MLVEKYLPANAGDIKDVSSIPGSERSLGGGNGNPLQYSCLENPMDRGAWQATVHRVTKSWTRLKQQHAIPNRVKETIKKKSQVSIFEAYECKNLQQNVIRLNQQYINIIYHDKVQFIPVSQEWFNICK